jgi:hypothetical protein
MLLAKLRPCLMTWSPGGRRRRGRPGVKWGKETQRVIKQRNLASDDVRNRQRWRLKISSRWVTAKPERDKAQAESARIVSFRKPLIQCTITICTKRLFLSRYCAPLEGRHRSYIVTGTAIRSAVPSRAPCRVKKHSVYSTMCVCVCVSVCACV